MVPSLQDHGTHLAYAGFAALASLAIYVFMPSLPSFLSPGSEDESPESSRFSRNSRYVVGLYNKANDCFANSVLQGLASSPILRQYLDDSRFQDQPLTVALKTIIQELNSPIRYPRAISPWPFLHVLEVIYKSRITRSQHDAHELLHLILETITDEHDRKLREIAAKESSPSIGDVAEDEKVDRHVTVPHEFMPFEGSTVDTIRCLQCGNSPEPKSTNFIVLTLNVPQKSSATLEDCLSSLLSSEHISDYGCQSCRLNDVIATVSELVIKMKLDDTGQRIVEDSLTSSHDVPDFDKDPLGYLHYLRNLDPNIDLDPEIEARLPKSVKSTIVRTTSFGHLPDLLTFHLSRSIFSSTATRNSCRVTFPEKLTVYSSQNVKSKFSSLAMGNGEDGQSVEGGSKTYRLVAMVRHMGTHSAGHYECYRRKEMFKNYGVEAIAALTENAEAAAAMLRIVEPLSRLDGNNISARQDISSSPLSGAISQSESSSVAPSRDESPSRLQRRPRNHTTTAKLYRQFTGGKSWWRTSDDKVWECTTDEVLRQTQSAYLLLYERVQPAKSTSRSSSWRRASMAQKL
ncbi:hypothetical protein V1525DRAFT_152159 [Lipomyces kononenkoae]|uniref:Uncharacterized protein n=1 Tax=Lipomyces kononenkoae TaxID=34357 RepID=A0ACC3T1A1_LIPKO